MREYQSFRGEQLPKRITLSDANKKRSCSIFAAIYQSIYKQYKHFSSDSNSRTLTLKDLKILDSYTISLFSDDLNGASRNPTEGKRKVVSKHNMINCLEDVPCLFCFTSAVPIDYTFLKELDLRKDSFVMFDKVNLDYLQYPKWTG